MRKAISITLEKKVLEEIDDIKNKHVPRSRFIEDILEEFLTRLITDPGSVDWWPHVSNSDLIKRGKVALQPPQQKTNANRRSA